MPTSRMFDMDFEAYQFYRPINGLLRIHTVSLDDSPLLCNILCQTERLPPKKRQRTEAPQQAQQGSVRSPGDRALTRAESGRRLRSSSAQTMGSRSPLSPTSTAWQRPKTTRLRCEDRLDVMWKNIPGTNLLAAEVQNMNGCFILVQSSGTSSVIKVFQQATVVYLYIR